MRDAKDRHSSCSQNVYDPVREIKKTTCFPLPPHPPLPPHLHHIWGAFLCAALPFVPASDLCLRQCLALKEGWMGALDLGFIGPLSLQMARDVF